MMKKEFIKLYWRQYQMLEKNIIETDDYVSLDANNYGTFSAQYLKIFLTECSEIDSLAEQMRILIKEKNPDNDINSKDISILKKIAAVKVAFERLDRMTIVTKHPFEGIRNTPFAKFDEDSSDSWWQDYNHVKHNRSELISGSNKYYYEKANLKNCLIALSALYLLCILMYELLDGDVKDLETNLFELGYRFFN